MNIIDTLLTAKTAEDSLISEMDDCQFALDTIAKIQSYIDAPDVIFNKDTHIRGSLGGHNSVKGYYLQITTDKITGDVVDIRLKPNDN